MSVPSYSEPGSEGSINRLSERQRTCLMLAGEGLSSGRIGARLNLSSRTVDEHLLLACRVLGVRTRIQAVARWTAATRRQAEPRSFAP